MFVLGSYPIHYHMALDVDSDRSADGPFVRSNTIRDTFSRCVTIHGTSGVRVEDNVAVDHFGHCYFLGGYGWPNSNSQISFGFAYASGMPNEQKSV